MVGLQPAVDAAGLEPLLLELVKMRASQINGCAYCLDMHSKDARALGESEQRLHLLAAWRKASLPGGMCSRRQVTARRSGPRPAR